MSNGEPHGTGPHHYFARHFLVFRGFEGIGARWPRWRLGVLFFPALLVLLSGCARLADNMPANACSDLTGRWTSAVFQPLKVFTDGSREIQGPTSTTLDVVYQEGCQFQAVNSWSSGKLGGSEQVVGTISGETGMITMAEIGPHAKSGSSGLIIARLVGEGKMTWEYVGLADDDTMGQVFITELVKK